MAAGSVRRQFSVTEYHRMAEADILGEDDRVELIVGYVRSSRACGCASADRSGRLIDDV